MLYGIYYDKTNKVDAIIVDETFKNKFSQNISMSSLSEVDIKIGMDTGKIDFMIIVEDHKINNKSEVIRNFISDNKHISVIIVSEEIDYLIVREAFCSGVFDYLSYERLIDDLEYSLMRVLREHNGNYFPQDLRNKMKLLIKHLFEAGNNIQEHIDDIVEYIYNECGNNSIDIQQVVERLKLESYNYFVTTKPWLDKFIYKGDYIREKGFECYTIEETRAQLTIYYSEVNELFKRYNIIDVNPTIYTIGKSVIKYVDEKVTLDKVAKDVFMNKSYISYIFKEKTGESFHDFIIKVKIDRAKTLLHIKEISIGEVAEKLYFSSTGYFSSLFKKQTGVSPTLYKKTIIDRTPK